MDENLTTPVEILTHAMESLEPLFEAEVVAGNLDRIEALTDTMCRLSRAITEAVHCKSELTFEKALELLERMKADMPQ